MHSFLTHGKKAVVLLVINPAGPDWFWYLWLFFFFVSFEKKQSFFFPFADVFSRMVLNVWNCCWLKGKKKNKTASHQLSVQHAQSCWMVGDCCRCTWYSVDDKWNATLTGRKWTVLAAAACAVRLGFLASRRQGGRQEAARDKGDGRRDGSSEERIDPRPWGGSNVSDFICQ